MPIKKSENKVEDKIEADEPILAELKPLELKIDPKVFQHLEKYVEEGFILLEAIKKEMEKINEKLEGIRGQLR